MKPRILLLFLLLFLPRFSYADPAAPPPSPEFDQLRAKRPVIRAYFESLLVRNLGHNIGVAMHGKGFSDEQIREVLDGKAFADYSRRLLRDPRVDRSLDRFLNRLVAPGALEAMMQKKSIELAARKQSAMVLAVEELVRAQQQRGLSQETAKTPATLWQRAWSYLTGDLW